MIAFYMFRTNSLVGMRDRDHKSVGQELNVRKEQADVLRLYLHELGHVIGLNHEHSRRDRDHYVKINSQNIVSGVGHNFAKLNYDKKTPYDYFSIMHYGVRDYAKGNKKSIEILNPENLTINIDSIGTRRRLSEHDIDWVNKMYNCKGEYYLFNVHIHTNGMHS